MSVKTVYIPLVANQDESFRIMSGNFLCGAGQRVNLCFLRDAKAVDFKKDLSPVNSKLHVDDCSEIIMLTSTDKRGEQV